MNKGDKRPSNVWKGSRRNNATGVAGELRVMSELLLRGFKPAKSYWDDGADLILSDGTQIEVKSTHLFEYPEKSLSMYTFNLKGGGRKLPQNLDGCDFIILWCIEDNWFLIIPTNELTTVHIGISKLPPTSKYHKYKDAWHLLERK